MSRKRPRYIIVSQKSIASLRHEVNGYINLGYLPSGGIVIDPDTRNLLQAMLLTAPTHTLTED